MENTIFRSALGGFNRQDVMAYIEKAQKEAAETVLSPTFVPARLVGLAVKLPSAFTLCE